MDAVEWWWLEDVYWGFCIHVPRSPTSNAEICSEKRTTAAWARKVELFWEDELALEMGQHKYASSEYFSGEGFVLRVDYAIQMERFAVKAGEEVFELLAAIMRRKGLEERLGRREMRNILATAKLCAGEQLNVQL